MLYVMSKPLYGFLKKNWGKKENAFSEVKQILLSDVLVHYDPNLSLKLACDASEYGIGSFSSKSELRKQTLFHTEPESSHAEIIHSFVFLRVIILDLAPNNLYFLDR